MKRLIITTIIVSAMSISTGALFAQDSENEGKDIFENNCASCHTSGFKGWLSGAPEIGEKAEWKKHFENDLTTLTEHVFEGTQRHEARGDCEECSQEQIKKAIEYIVANSK